MSSRTIFWTVSLSAVFLCWFIFLVTLFPDPEPLADTMRDFEVVTRSEEIWRVGVEYHQLGQLEEALAKYEEAIALNPEDKMAYLFRGKWKYEHGDYAGADEDYTRGYELDPTFKFAIIARSVNRYRAGDMEGALADADLALEIDPDYICAPTNLAVMKRLNGDFDGAMQGFKDVLAGMPEEKRIQVHVLENMALIRIEQGRLEDAIGYYSSILDRYTSQDRFYGLRSELYKQLGEIEKAAADFQKFRAYDQKYQTHIEAIRARLNPPE